MVNEYTRQWTPSKTDCHVPNSSRCSPSVVGQVAALFERVYDMAGIDRDRVAVEQAAERIPNGRFIELDQRDLIGAVPLLAIANKRRPCHRRSQVGCW